jgi:uncharacterized protein (TIGR00725 family)
MPYQVAVCGPRNCTEQDADHARRVGELLAERGVVVLCGGGTGVMAAVTEGAASRGGLVIGVRPDDDRRTAHPDLSAVVVTNLGEARNAVIVWSADALIVVGGSWGTLSELALAKRRGGIPVISIGGWSILDSDGNPVLGIEHVLTPEDAVDQAMGTSN